MMNRSRSAAVYAVVTGLLAMGGITAGMTAASANTAGFCSASGVKATCTEQQTITDPAAISVSAKLTAGDAQDATIAWSATCTLSGSSAKVTGGSTSETPVADNLILPFTDPDSCVVSATVTLSGTGSVLLSLTYAPAAAPSPTPTTSIAPTYMFHGFDGKCLDASGNGSANRTRIIIWTCNPRDAAQYFTYSAGVLGHNGKCVNDQRAGGNGSHAILYTCNGASNEIWTHRPNGELVLQANGGKLCLDDPAYSTRSGTQLIVWSCKDSSNQRWSQS
jgi:Ricin-type beta-trefoil lectin domain